jgi:hypothetical protein
MKNIITFSFLAFALILAVIYPLVTPFNAVDMEAFLRAANGSMPGYYYAPWGLHFFQLLNLLPYEAAHIVVNLINVIGFWLACRAFRGSIPVVMTSYALMFTMFYGQIDGLWAMGLVLLYIGIKRQNTPLAVVGWMIALVKYYIAFPLGIGLLWCFADFKSARQILVFTGLALLGTLLLYGLWPLETLERLRIHPATNQNAIDLWRFFGPFVLLLWIPVLWTRNRSYTIFAATWALTTPYIHPHGLTHLLVTAGPIGVVGHIGYLIGYDKSLVLLQITSLLVYLSPLFPHLWMWLSTIPPFSRWLTQQPAPSS